jgi:valyl-tRNA synthetase
VVGQRIPAWYDKHGNFVVAKTENEAKKQLATKLNLSVENIEITQDEDVLDTWFTPGYGHNVFDGFKDPDNKDINYYYPTNDLITAPEILFLGSTYAYSRLWNRGQKPFTNVYLTGIVRDKLGRK